MEEAEKTASNSKKADSEVSPDNSDSALEPKRKRKPNIFIFMERTSIVHEGNKPTSPISTTS